MACRRKKQCALVHFAQHLEDHEVRWNVFVLISFLNATFGRPRIALECFVFAGPAGHLHQSMARSLSHLGLARQLETPLVSSTLNFWMAVIGHARSLIWKSWSFSRNCQYLMSSHRLPDVLGNAVRARSRPGSPRLPGSGREGH